MDDTIFKLSIPLVLSKVVDSLDEIHALMGQSTEIDSLMDKTTSMDIRGDVYEYLLSKISTAGRNGQFRNLSENPRPFNDRVDSSQHQDILFE